eukprot:2819185-Amphidinium_carterae.1
MRRILIRTIHRVLCLETLSRLDREQSFDDEAWDTALSEVEAGREQVGTCSQVGVFGGPKQLLSSPTDNPVPPTGS